MNMLSSIRKIPRAWLRVMNTWKKIGDLEIDPDQKKLLRSTFWNTFFRGRYQADEKRARIMNCDMKFLSFESLEYLFNHIFLGQEYAFHTDKAAPVIFDCGSNIGMSLLYFKTRFPAATITCFEPDRSAFGCLAENVRQNGLEKVTLHQRAVSRCEGSIDFYCDADKPGSLIMSTLPDRQSKDTYTVEAVRLSTYISGEVDFLKLDVEGAEMDVLADLVESGKLAWIKQMGIEYHHHIVKTDDHFSQLLGLLEKEGFGYQIEGRIPRPFPREEFQDCLVYAYRKSSLPQ